MSRIATAIIVSTLLVSTIWILKPDQKSEQLIPSRSSEALEFRESSKWMYDQLVDPVTGQMPANIRSQELAFAADLPKAHFPRRDNMWQSRGPWNIGGRTRGLVIDALDEDRLLTATVSGGIWESEDGGQSWTKLTKSDQLHTVTCLTQDTRTGKENIWYYGTGEAYGASQSATGAYFLGDGLFKSTDNGKTWSSLTATARNFPQGFNSVWQLVWNVTTDPSVDTADVVYAATYGNIHRSEDGGDSWTTVLGNANYFTDVAVSSQGTAYATLSSDGGQPGIWRSPDGADWTAITPDSFPVEYDRIVIGIDPNDENTVYFLAHTPGSGNLQYNYLGDADWNSLWRYTYIKGNGADTNGTWMNLSYNLPQDTVLPFNGFNAQGSYDMLVAVQPGNSNNVFIGGTNIYRSTDGFTSRNNTTQIGGYKIDTKQPEIELYPNNHPDQHVIRFLPSNPDVLINANDGGVFKTTDCLADTVEWETLNNGYLTTQLYTVTIDHHNTNNILIGGLQDNNVQYANSMDPQYAWSSPLFGDGSYCAIASDGYTYLSKQRGKTYKMDLDTNGQVQAFRRMDPIGGRFDFINPFVVDPNDPNRMYMIGERKLWINDSLDQIPLSNEWDSISTGWRWLADTLTSEEFSAVAISTNPPNRLYLGTNNKKLYRVDNAHLPGAQLTDITYNLFNNANIGCIAIDPHDADRILAVFTNYNVYSLFHSEDGGQNWEKAAGNMEQTPFGNGNGPSLRWADMLHLPNGKTIYFVGTSVGLFATDTIMGHNTVWLQMAPDLIGNVVVDMIKTRQQDGLVAVGTHGTGAYSANVTSWDILTEVPKQMKSQPSASIFPNPTTDRAWIELDFPDPAEVDIRMYDIMGRNVQSVYSGSLDKQENRIPLEVGGLSTGQYFVVVDWDGRQEVVPLVVAK